MTKTKTLYIVSTHKARYETRTILAESPEKAAIAYLEPLVRDNGHDLDVASVRVQGDGAECSFLIAVTTSFSLELI